MLLWPVCLSAGAVAVCDQVGDREFGHFVP